MHLDGLNVHPELRPFLLTCPGIALRRRKHFSKSLNVHPELRHLFAHLSRHSFATPEAFLQKLECSPRATAPFCSSFFQKLEGLALVCGDDSSVQMHHMMILGPSTGCGKR